MMSKSNYFLYFRRIGVVAAALLLSVVCVLWFWPAEKNPEELPTITHHEPRTTEEPAEITDWQFDSNSFSVVSVEGELREFEVLDNPDCSIKRSENLALITVPSDDGAKYSVLGESGAIHTGTLPFFPNHLQMGESADGSIVWGFGDLRRNSLVFREKYASEPVRIYVDGAIAYENDKIWSFGIANDGSSFFVVEPLGERESRLVIHNLNEGAERHYDLGATYGSASDYEGVYSSFYTLHGNEVHLSPGDWENGTHYFYPTGGSGEKRELRIEDANLYREVNLVSSVEGYFAYSDYDSSAFWVMKRSVDWQTGAIRTVWDRSGPTGIAAANLQLQTTSDGAEWLMFETFPYREDGRRNADWMYYLMDARTGDLVFTFPRAGEQPQRMRLASVLANEVQGNDIGSVTNWFITGDKLYMRRAFADSNNALVSSKAVYDVFDMNNIALDSQPIARIPTEPTLGDSCGKQAQFQERSLQERNGKLVYAAALP